MKYTFSDEVLAAIAHSVQLGMLTATDVVDHLRLLEVEAGENDALVLTSACKARHERNIADLEARAIELSKQMRRADDVAQS